MQNRRIISLFEVLTAFINIAGWMLFGLAVLAVCVFGDKLGRHSIFVGLAGLVPVLFLTIWNLLYAAATDPAL